MSAQMIGQATARLAFVALALAVPAVMAACAGNSDEEDSLGPGATQVSSPAAAERASPTAVPSGPSETALREAVTAYERALARSDLPTAYALEPAEFRETCPFEEYEDLIAPLWDEWVDDCRFDDTSKVDFVIEEVAVDENAWVSGYWEDQSGQRCGGYGQWCYRAEWNYRNGGWVPVNTLPCAYARENQRLLDALPRLPAAEEVKTDPYIYTRSEGPPFRHTVLVTYEAPRDMSAQDVIDFYVESLAPEWQHTIATYGGPSLLLDLTRGTAAIQVDLTGMSMPGSHTFNVHVDNRGAEPW